jgi:uncharacterized protein YbaP (TraB family)
MELFLWKIKFYLGFYKSKKSKNGMSSLLGSVKVALNGVFSSKGHDSKLQTAFHNAFTSLIDTMKSTRRRWISKKEEVNLIKEWDNIYRQIRNEKLSKGIDEISPIDTRNLYKVNVINRVKKEHETTWMVNGVKVTPPQ